VVDESFVQGVPGWSNWSMLCTIDWWVTENLLYLVSFWYWHVDLFNRCSLIIILYLLVSLDCRSLLQICYDLTSSYLTLSTEWVETVLTAEAILGYSQCIYTDLHRPLSNEGQINVLLWYCLVGAYVGLPLGVEGSPGGKWLCVVRGWRSPPSWHLLMAGVSASEQVRLVKTVKVQ